MAQYIITSTGGTEYGVWEAETPKDAFIAMLAEAGGEYGDSSVGTEEDWIITELAF